MQEIIAVLDAGITGSGIARVFGRAGHGVRVFDLDRPDAARAAESAGASAHDGIASAVDGATIVLEAAPERLALKRELLAEAEAANGDALIASNTADALAAGMRDPSRLVIARFFNHADTVPLVEVMPGPATPQAAVDRMVGLLTAAGKVAVPLAQQVEGFIASRLQAALYREAMHLVELGVVSPAGRSGRHGRARAALGVRRPLRDHGPRGFGRVDERDGRDLPDARGRIRRPMLRERAERGELGAKMGVGFRPREADASARFAARREGCAAGVAGPPGAPGRFVRA